MRTPSSPLHGEAVRLRNNVHTCGRGPRTMVFAHGFGCDQNMWRFVAPAFEDDFHVVLFDYVGSGRSDLSAFDPRRYGSLEGYAQDLLDVCEALDLRDAVLVGHSVSAMIGLLAALRQPQRFSSLAMIGPSPRYINDPPDYHGGFERSDLEGLLSLMDHNYIGWASTLAPIVMANPERPELGQELQDSFCSTDPVAAKAFARATFFADNRADLPKLKHPSLIVQVSDDAIAPVSVGRYMHAHMPGSEFALLEAVGHCPHMSHPQDTIEVLRRFVDPGRVHA
jgi:sigma-B regulation protein RsbQ